MVNFFDYESIATFVVILGAALAFFILGVNVYKAMKDLKAPRAQQEEFMRNLDNKIDNLTEKSDDRDEKIDKLIAIHIKDVHAIKKENSIQTSAIQILLKHEIDGNDIEALKKEYEAINKHLLNRGVNEYMAGQGLKEEDYGH